jgi:arylsulfatase A-like enzyme
VRTPLERRTRLHGILAALASAALVTGTVNAQADDQPADDPRPNFVVITADDMRRDDVAYMPHTKALLGQLKLTQFISNHPLCCPARAELMTGQLADNNGVFHNDGPFGGHHALREPDNTLASWLYDAGYKTGFVGKFLNGWDPELGAVRPGGWSHFNAWVRNGSSSDLIYTTHDYWDWNDGEIYQPGIYTNDAVTRETTAQIREFAGTAFFVYASYVAPHGMKDPVTDKYFPSGPRPAARHKNMFSATIPPYQSKPSFDYGPERTRELRIIWRNRIRSLQSVDEGVRDIVQTLQETGELDDTVVLFTSDNGFALGEHRAVGKNLPWEEVLRVPFLARGPIPAGTTSKGAMLTDVAPSIAALAGVTPGRVVDGRADLFSLGGGWADTLIQAGSHNFAEHFQWRGTRTSRWTYVHWIGGRKELYDRANDRYQLRNLAGKRPAVERSFADLTPDPY